ncbi:hypothetical protein QC762_302900 [Podospora pseudocomata]|uniref:Cytochrome P450 E-class, group I n=1 Tax=Podospora pseudocomata TaxID=2093779 RepID=A0ABR0GIM4_9PEZI|nr:hypothetical protein QC762_302900 [Podospora pseudocomata]
METITPWPLVAAIVGGLCWMATTVIWRLYFHPLSRFPGPKLTAVTLWYEFYWNVVKKGQFMWRVEEMHQRYGPIVRINPHELHILDPDFYDELYGCGVNSKRKLDKYEWWTRLAVASSSTFTTVPHDLHRLRRAALNPFFSVASVTKLEPLIKSKVEKLSARLDKIAQTGEVFRLDAALMALTMDVICDYSFGHDRKYLDKPDFELQFKEAVVGATGGCFLMMQFPWIPSLMERIPQSIVKRTSPGVAYMLARQEDMIKQVNPILAGTDGEKSGARSIFHALRDNENLPPSERTLKRMCDEATLLTGAGSETTGQTLTRMFFYLKHVPDALERFREELDVAIPSEQDIPSWSTLQQLPYLTAVIKEALRLSYGITTRLPRVAHEAIIYKQYVIPAGTPVSQTGYFILMDPTVFPEPHVFKPERWLGSGKRLDRYLVPFGRGSRACLGIRYGSTLAYAEMYLTAATIVKRFDWEMYETTLGRDIACHRDAFVALGAHDSPGVRATMSRRKL